MRGTGSPTPHLDLDKRKTDSPPEVPLVGQEETDTRLSGSVGVLRVTDLAGSPLLWSLKRQWGLCASFSPPSPSPSPSIKRSKVPWHPCLLLGDSYSGISLSIKAILKVQSDIRGFLSSLSRELAAGLGLLGGKKIGCVCVCVCVWSCRVNCPSWAWGKQFSLCLDMSPWSAPTGAVPCPPLPEVSWALEKPRVRSWNRRPQAPRVRSGTPQKAKE
jgi:hypothetical protein